MDEVDSDGAVRSGRGRPRDPAIGKAAIEAALDLLVESGAEAVTVDAVARRIGSTRAAIYRRWPNAEDLLWAAMDHAMMVAARRDHLAPPYSIDGLDLEQALRQSMRRLVEIVSELRFAASYLAVATATQRDASLRAGFDRHTRLFLGKLAELLTEAQSQLPSTTVAHVADLAIGIVFHKVLLLGSPMDAAEIEALAAILSDGAMATKQDRRP